MLVAIVDVGIMYLIVSYIWTNPCMYMYTCMYVYKHLYNIYGLSDRWDASHQLSLSPSMASIHSQSVSASTLFFNIIDQPSDMSASDKSLADLEATLASSPQVAGNPIATSILTWVVGAFHLLIRFIHGVSRDLLNCIDSIEEGLADRPAIPHVEEAGMGTSRAQAQSRGGDATQNRQCCAKCHAHGHSTDACLTKDPTGMKKRVAQNQKGHQVSQSKARPPVIQSLPTPLHQFYPAQMPSANSPYITATLVADTEELCQRQRQSGHDRRKHHATTTSS